LEKTTGKVLFKNELPNHIAMVKVSPYKRVVKRNINECIAVFEDLKSAIHTRG
jgi:hypothetical protein